MRAALTTLPRNVMMGAMFPLRIRPLAAALVLSSASVLAQPAPDFSLRDVNTNSPRANAMVSPRDYLLQVTGYYFGAAH